jgi:ATP:corrinoid adenosyltransferase
VSLPSEAWSAPLRFVAAPGSPIRVDGNPNDIVAADLNGDGSPDLVATNGGTSAVSILLGNGHGAFAPGPGAPLPAPFPPHMAVVGDINDDDKPDLIASGHDSHGVSVWLGDGEGRFQSAAGSPFAALSGGKAHNHGLALGDLDGDGDLDVATTDDEVHVVAVLLGNGKGGFEPAPRSPFAVGRQPYPLALGDINGDARLDVVTPNVESGSLSILLGDGRGGFTPATGTPIRVSARPYFVALGDLDGDRKPDVVASHDDDTRVTVLLGDGRGGFRPAAGSPLDVGRRPWKVVLHDMDRNGTKDLVLAAGGVVAVMLGDGRGRFSPAAGSPFPVGRGAWSVAVSDFDGDGRADFATANLETGTISVLLQD